MIRNISTLAKRLAALAALAMLPTLSNAQDNVEIVSADTATVDIDVANPLDNQPGLYGSEMIAEKMPVAEVHASTIVEIEGGLATAWFGGTKEKARDVVIWMSRNTGNGWSKPIVVADGVNPKDRTQQACWNPVLFKQSTGSLILFYKVGPSPTRWWGMMKRSDDDGVTWKKPVRLPDGFVGPVKNKPIELSNRTLLCGSSLEDADCAGGKIHPEPLLEQKQAAQFSSRSSAIQPTLLQYPDGPFSALPLQVRTPDRAGVPTTAASGPRHAERHCRSKSGADGTVLADGRALLVYNHTRNGRSPLNVSVSSNGKEWEGALCSSSG